MKLVQEEIVYKNSKLKILADKKEFVAVALKELKKQTVSRHLKSKEIGYASEPTQN
jgi:hypothetical protein